MKPSEKAKQAAASIINYPGAIFYLPQLLEVAYAIDIDPLLAAKDAEIERLKHKKYDCEHVAQDVIQGGCPKCELIVAESSNTTLHKRISELEAENQRLSAALELVSGAIVDVGANWKVKVPADPMKYGDAIREIEAEASDQ